MMRFFLSGIFFVLLCSCGGEMKSEGKDGEKKAPTSMINPHASNPDYIKGLEFVERYQCFTCHKTDEKLTGPSYREIAEKYAGAGDPKIADIAKKIIDGGSGVWGALPMTPHPNVSEEDAKTMVKYILLLKK